MSVRAVLAIAQVSLLDAWRSRVWVPVLAVLAAVCLGAPYLSAVDAGDRRRLALTLGCAALAGLTVALAALLPPAWLRRDLDARTSLLLFSKPIGRWRYLAGRFCGALLVAGAAAITVACGCALLLPLATGDQRIQAVRGAVALERVSALGEVTPAEGGRDALWLSGPPGDGVRWRFEGLPSGREVDLLIKGELRGDDGGARTDRLSVLIAAGPSEPGRILALAPDSPYGNHPGLSGGALALRHRDPPRADYATDWLRLRLPAEAVSATGTCVVQLTRLEATAKLIARRGNCLVAEPGGGLLGNLLAGALIIMAQAAMFAALALAAATVAGLAVSLLAGLTWWLALSARWTISETLTWDRSLSLPGRRLLEVLQSIIPDLDRHLVAARLAAGQAIPFADGWAAWWHLAPWMAVFLLVAWVGLWRREL